MARPSDIRLRRRCLFPVQRFGNGGESSAFVNEVENPSNGLDTIRNLNELSATFVQHEPDRALGRQRLCQGSRPFGDPICFGPGRFKFALLVSADEIYQREYEAHRISA